MKNEKKYKRRIIPKIDLARIDKAVQLMNNIACDKSVPHKELVFQVMVQTRNIQVLMHPEQYLSIVYADVTASLDKKS